ncbi:DUF3754 domain-containing protein [Dactylosporangium matsuzakiense]|uniref:Uncharacterized protein n=1 Tax=Dactylosporangium matsuzakiense TaxID=53360 RepID=A0A9W6KVJ6_9ACTN|nr:DUF3754 domain-containing protein [Dactylosporangium matsuzakiense]UWZ43869.1 DUF3754 domain-containing protein [Dactylosporangium matsuzakiense]GLL07489.1 hypothetical protein GCM10017581_092410 [Dactylosporangium matsuzakiense]
MRNQKQTHTDLSAETPTAGADKGYERTKPKVTTEETALKSFKVKNATDVESVAPKTWRQVSPIDLVAMGLTGVGGSGIVAVVVCVFADANAAAFTVLGTIATTALGVLPWYLRRKINNSHTR